MRDCNPVKTPMDVNTKLSKSMTSKTEEKCKLKNIPYQNLVGSLLYLAITTRPGIMYTVNVLSQFNGNFSNAHWMAAKRVLRYLKHTIDYGIMFRKSNDDLGGYADADWGSNMDDRRSYTGYAFKLSDGPISWETKKQRTVALSSAEAEYMSLTEASKEAIHLKNILHEMGLRPDRPVKLFNDNRSAQSMAKNPTVNNRSKHIDIRHHFIKEAIVDKKVILEYLETESMPADIFTKTLNPPKFEKCLKLISVKEVK